MLVLWFKKVKRKHYNKKVEIIFLIIRITTVDFRRYNLKYLFIKKYMFKMHINILTLKNTKLINAEYHIEFGVYKY